MIKKPMLAVAVDDIYKIKYPLLCSPKLDGIRCLMVNGQPLSRKFKEIPNRHIRSELSSNLADLTLDGELMVPGKPFNEISSAVMSEDGEPKFEYWVFDSLSSSSSEKFQQRYNKLKTMILPAFCKVVDHRLVDSPDALLSLEKEYLQLGYEGLMIRSIDGPYKNGRSTLKEGFLLKLKQFADSEAEILDFEEKMHNANAATVDELGHTKRSSHKENMIPTNTLGAFVVRDIYSKQIFRVATGLDDEQRLSVWTDRSKYKGKLIKYRYQPAGMKDLPRFPVFVGFRDERDMDDV